jgi:hypothetical protein
MYGRSTLSYNPPKLAPLERLPKRHRVGPSASLDEYRTINDCESVSQGKGHVNLEKGCRIYSSPAFALDAKINSIFFQPFFDAKITLEILLYPWNAMFHFD